MNRTDGIADSSLDMCTHALCGFDVNFHVPYIINRIENPENINACCGRMFHEFHNNIIRIMPVSYQVLAAKKHLERKTPLQMLLRGQNLVGYRHYSDDIVVKFVEHAAATGVDIFRIFDAVNDIRNMEVSIKTAKRVGAHVQGTVCYTISPVHTIPLYVKMAKELEEMGCDSLCIKDMAALKLNNENTKVTLTINKVK